MLKTGEISIGICREVAESVKSEYCCYQYLKNCADLTEVFIGDTNVITEIIFSDYYRTFLLCILSIGVVFFMRNASIRKKVLALAGYEFMDTLFYNKYNIAVCNVLFFLEKK